MSGQPCAIGVDLGGQSVKLAVVDGTGGVHLRSRSAVDATQPAEAITRLLIDQITSLQARATAEGLAPGSVGVVMPGYMDRLRTRILFAANLPTLTGSNLLAQIRHGVELPVVFDADGNAAALGEYRFGAGRGIDRLMVAVVGTGIGVGVMIDGQIVRVRNHTGGSLGHVIVDATGPVCGCGARGCVEARASGRVLERRAAELAAEEPGSRLAALRAERGQLTGVEIGLALGDDDRAAGRAVRECGWWLGVGVASWSAVYAPRKVLIGGGMAALGEPLLSAVRDGFREVGQPLLTRGVVIEAAALGPDAGVIGAAAMAMSEQESDRRRD